jgi:hypothetical protein
LSESNGYGSSPRFHLPEGPIPQERIHTPTICGFSQTTDRMILVQVWKSAVPVDPEDEDTWIDPQADDVPRSIRWVPVIGLICAIQTLWSRRSLPREGPSHYEPEVWPITPGSGSMMHPPTNVYHTIHYGRGLIEHQMVVPCHWPPEEDRVQAIRIGRELIRGGDAGGPYWGREHWIGPEEMEVT